MNGAQSNRRISPLSRHGAAMRLRGMIRKEYLQILRDPSSLAIAFVLPAILLFLFGYGVSLDAEHVPIVVVVEQPSAATARLVGAFRGSRYFDPVVTFDMPEAIQAVRSRRAKAIVRLRGDFGAAMRRASGGSIQLLVDGIDANTARLVEGYVQGVWASWLAEEARATGRSLTMPVELDSRIWFNSEVRSRNFLVPGLMAVIMTLIGAMLTALVVAREWERGTMETLMVTPVAMREILIGKLLPYFLLGMGGMALSVAMAVFLFDVPLRGSLGVLFLASSLFLLTALGMGLLISSLVKNQFIASQLAVLTTFLPAFILSGFIFDIQTMPLVVRLLTYLVPARYFVAILQTVFLAGDVWSVILPNSLALALIAVVFFILTRRVSQKRLA